MVIRSVYVCRLFIGAVMAILFVLGGVGGWVCCFVALVYTGILQSHGSELSLETINAMLWTSSAVGALAGILVGCFTTRPLRQCLQGVKHLRVIP